MIQFKSSLLVEFDVLIFEFFQNNYFGFIESAEEYVLKIIDFIYENLDTFPHKKTPAELKNFSPNYIFFKINPRTTYYIFFE